MITAAATAIGALSNVVTLVNALDPDATNRELKISHSKLLGAMIEMQKSVSALVDENDRLKRELQSLKEPVELRQEMIFRDAVFYAKRPDGSEVGPYCPKCWQGRDKSLVLLHETFPPGGLKAIGLGCSVCGFDHYFPYQMQAPSTGSW